MNQTKWTQNNLFGTLDAVISHLDEWGACGVMVQREDLEAWRDTVLHLRSLLREVCEAAEHVPIWGSDGHARYVCAACEFQKPVDLCEFLIRTYTNPGDVVLDNAMGSGSVCLAARNTGRLSIGIEIDSVLCEKAYKRLSEFI